MAYQVNDPFEVVGNKDEAYICRGPFLSFFGKDMVKPPLPFHGSKWVFHNGLPAAVEFFFLFHVFSVLLVEWRKDIPGKEPSIFCPGAQVSHGAPLTGLCFVLFELTLVGLALMVCIKVAVGLQGVSLWAGILVLLLVVNEIL